MRIQEKLKSFLKLVVYSAVVSISSVFLTTGCQNDQPKDPLTVEEREWLTGHDGKIVLAHDPDAKPIDYLDDKDRFRGLAADYVHLIEKKLNFEFNIPRVKTWAEVLKKAKNKEIDVLCAITETPEREKWLLFTKPYIIIPTVILVRETIKESLTPDKMKGMKVTFTKGWVIDGYLRENYGYLDFDPSVDEQTAMNKVSLGEAEAWVTALTTSSILIEKHKITNLRVAGEMDLQFKLAIASRKDWPILNQILQKGLSLINEEERSAIFKKWIHIEGTSQISRKVWLGLIITAAAILLLIIATILWNRTLRLRVAKKTIELRDELDERRLAEEALRESEQQYRSLVESTEDSIYLVDRNSTYLFMNEKHLSRLGLQPDDILGRTYGEFHSEDDTQEFAALMEKIFETGQSIQQEHRSLKDNRHFLRTLSPIKEPKGRTRAITVVSKDITDRGRLEEVLRESEEKFRTFTEMAPVGVFVTDADGLTTYWNKRLCEITGMQVVDGLGTGWADGVHPDDRERVFKEWYESAEKRASFRCEYRFVDRDGAVTYTIGQAIPLTDASKQVTGYVGTITDVTDLKQADEALRESEEKLKAIFEAANSVSFITTDLGTEIGNDTRITSFSPGAEKMFGYREKEVIGKRVAMLHVAEDVETFPEIIDLVKKCKKGYSGETTLVRRSGDHFPVLFTVHALFDSNGEISGTLGVSIDISERRRLETQLQQAQKMEAVGTLAGGIAHDFNNLLMAIQGRTSIMLTKKDSSHPDIRHLKGIEDNVESAADLTRQLLGFARGGKYEVKPTDLNELVKKQNRMFGRTKKQISIRGKYEKDLWSVEVDQGQIDQVLLNLYVNAWQAMPAGGDLYLEIENVTLDENYVKPFAIEPGKYVKISVTDTGVGMDKETQKKIFDPFFTTKEMGRGTGLGLASAYGIIKNHGGFINVYSEKGHGTTFNIYLPASEKEIIEEKKSDGDTLRGSETVLFVDDEDMIIEVAEEMFEQLGYKVLIARSGKEAIEIYEENKEQVDIVLLDMIMPDMSGSDTYDRMKEFNPDIKVLLASGYSINGTATEIMDRGCDGFIQKPFKMKELSQKLREVLDKK